MRQSDPKNPRLELAGEILLGKALRVIFDKIQAALFLHTAEGELLDVNEFTLKLYGVSKDQAMGLSIRNDFSGPDAPVEMLDEYWDEAVHGGSPEFEWQARRPLDGSVFPVEVRLQTLDAGGRKLILATVRDLTMRRKAEEGLRASEERFRALFENAIDAIIVEDRDQRIIDANDRACLLFGYTHEELTALRSVDLHADTEPLLPIYENPDQDINIPLEMTAIHKSGHRVPIEFTISAFEAGGQVLFMSIIRDNTERKRAEEALRRSEGSIKRAYVAKQKQMDQIAQVHAQFLTNSFPPAGGLKFSAQCRPAADVGGDFYFVETMADGRTAICIADVSGHGAIAAVATATSRALLLTALQEMRPGDEPGDVLSRTSRWLRGQLGDEQFVTAWLGFWDAKKKELRYASAAHPPAVLIRKESEPEFLPQTISLPVGLVIGDDNEKIVSHGVDLREGDRVIIYTDGWTETPSRTGEHLDGERFLDFLLCAEGQTVAKVPVILLLEFERHVANARVRDDVTLLVFDRVE